MTDLNKIKKIIESKTCKTHGKQPTVEINNSAINLSCCCDEFKDELYEIIQEEVLNQAGDAVNDIFKDF